MHFNGLDGMFLFALKIINLFLDELGIFVEVKLLSQNFCTNDFLFSYFFDGADNVLGTS